MHLINVILNSQKQVTAIYSGDYIAAHREGCRAAAELSMIRLNRKFPIVITTNSGYPLDQNLYQTVKGIWTAARIVEQGGAIIVASECSKGIPDDGNFANLMSARSNADDLLDFFSHDAHHIMDRWQAQKLAMALKKAEIFVYTSLGENKVSECKMRKIEDISSAISELVTKIGRKPEIAVLPRGPVTIPI